MMKTNKTRLKDDVRIKYTARMNLKAEEGMRGGMSL
jgi:hypothetical protein